MKIIIDNSNLFAGGGIQVTTSFLYDLNKLNLDYEFYVVQSPNSSKQINKHLFSSKFHFYDLTEKNFIRKRRRIKFLKDLEKSIKPNIIFTTFGPSYYSSKCTKIVGFAIPHLIYKDSPFFKNIPRKRLIRLQVLFRLKKYFFIKNSDALIFETEDSRKVFMRTCNDKIKSFTVHNTLNEIFHSKEKWRNFKFNRKCGLRILCLSANYEHKNVAIIPLIIDLLIGKYKMNDFSFVISCKKSDLNFPKKYDPYIDYIGQVDLNQIPVLYRKIDFVIMPSLLEVFSTTYLEAMFMNKPIIASDMSFAREICRDSALYCSPLDASNYAVNIFKLAENKSLREELIRNGQENIKRFGDSMRRTKQYLSIIEDLSK